jgi:vacuolar-type H+-ATPase subunit I/STV1
MPSGVESMSAKRKRAEEAVEELRGELERQGDEAEKVRADAVEAAAKVKADAAAEAAKVKQAAANEAEQIMRMARAERAALDAEKAAMEKTYEFQTKKTLLNVGGIRFETSLPTLTSVRDTYIGSMFSGCFPLAPDPTDGAYFIDRSGAHFEHILNYLRDPGRDLVNTPACQSTDRVTCHLTQ